MACAKGWQSQCARGKPAAPAPSGLREDGCKFAPSRHAALGGCSKLSTVTLRRISLRQADTASVIIYRACNSIYITSAPLAANDCCNATTANFSWSQWNCSSAAMQLNTDGKADANMNWQRPSQCKRVRLGCVRVETTTQAGFRVNHSVVNEAPQPSNSCWRCCAAVVLS